MEYFALILAFIFFVTLFLSSRKYQTPTLFLPHIKEIKAKKSLKQTLSYLPSFFKFSSLILLSIGFIYPQKITHIPYSGKSETGLILYLALDQSASMQGDVSPSSGMTATSLSKFTLLQKVAHHFLDSYKHNSYKDRIGLLGFARSSEIISPATTDYKSLQDKIADLKPLTLNDNQGTAIGYAIYKASQFIQNMKENQDEAVIILLTDGFQNPHQEDILNNSKRTIDLISAAQIAAANNIHLYIVNLEPRILTPQYSSQRNLLRQSAEITKGTFTITTSFDSLNDTLKSIAEHTRQNFLDKQQTFEKTISQATPFLLIAWFFLLLSEILNVSWIRKYG